MKKIFWGILSISILGIIISWIDHMPDDQEGDLLIQNVTVIDVRAGVALKNQQVLIREQNIIMVAENNKKLKAKKVLDGTGKFLIPGLWDMHTHNWWQIHFSDHYIANGVLGVRNMYTPMSLIRPLKDSIDKGLLDGPQYIAAGRVLEGKGVEFPDWICVDTKDKIEKALDTLQMEGSDFVKVYSKLPREVYFELVKAAHKRGMRVEGHLPMSVNALEASNAGQRSLEHLLGIPELFTKDSLFKNKHNYNWFAAVMNEDDYGTIKIDESIGKKNLETLVRNKTYICPTLVVWNSYLHPDTLFERDMLLQKFPEEVRGYWKGAIDKYRKKDAAYKQMAIKKYENLRKVIHLLYKNGVSMLVGTDAINPYCYPGYSLHKELELLRNCGLPNAEVLKMATLNAAEFLGMENKQGEVKAGFIASLVLLNADPLKDISNTQQIEAVILKGKVLDRSSLSKLKR